MTGEQRRPLAVRNTRLARALARRLAASRVTPNQISQASMIFAAAGFGLFWASASLAGLPKSLCLAGAAAAMQLRLLCNLMDGMVAVEGSKSSPTGPFWNEAPDRISDVLFFAGAGLAAGWPALGLLTGALAVATAYLRELGRAEGLAPDFSGPMAKPQRMAMLTAGTLVAALVQPSSVLAATLWIVALGTGTTVLRRSIRILTALAGR